MLLQVSRFDRFKDPLGVIEAYRLVKPYHRELQLVLAGGPADDDPEGAEVFREVHGTRRRRQGHQGPHAPARLPPGHQRPSTLRDHRPAKIASRRASG